MNPNPNPKQVVKTALLILGLAASVSAGIIVRNRMDQRGMTTDLEKVDGLFASSHADSKDIPLIPYYEQVEQILKEQYVEPISDEQKLASGAIRGMVNSLGDPHSRYFDAKEFTAFENIQTQGKYEGIGASLILNYNGHADAADDPTGMIESTGMLTIPRLEVATVVPGGPADKAGIKPGDIIDSVDNHWVINPIVLEKYRKLSASSTDQNTPELVQMRKDLRKKSDGAILPTRAWSRLVLGTSGTTNLTIFHGDGNAVPVQVGKAVAADPGNSVEADGHLRLWFNEQAPEFLKSHLAGSLTLDLRNVCGGDLASMKKCLELLAPAGTYGTFKVGHSKANEPLSIEAGADKPATVTILTNKGTRGVAQIFALALSSHGIAKLEGEPMAHDRERQAIEKLPDGSGFCLATGEFVAEGAKS